MSCGFDTATPQLISDFARAPSDSESAARRPFDKREEEEMHLHLVRVARAEAVARPAKVVELETRRKARLEQARPAPFPPAA